MPSVNIFTGSWARGQERALLEAVHAAMVSAIGVPEGDRDAVLDCYDDSHRLVPASSSDRYTRVEIKLFAGRSIEAKRALYRDIVQNLAALGVPAHEIKIVLIEVERHNWGLRGGVPGSELTFAFKVDV
jgi:phenylpyruvate tautomerase PptA (4-oxalocrotonate tautomerase family)